MTTAWNLTVDCHDVRVVSAFWRDALGYVDAAPPTGWSTWEGWLSDQGVPRAEWDDGVTLEDPEGRAPSLTFLVVPEAKTTKNRLHLDLQVSGGRHLDQDARRRSILACVDRLSAAGGAVVQEVLSAGSLDHVVMRDPEGNELCVV